jgi:hypothetical protein
MAHGNLLLVKMALSQIFICVDVGDDLPLASRADESGRETRAVRCKGAPFPPDVILRCVR